MTYLTYAARPDMIDAEAVRKSFASIEYMNEIMSRSNAESREASLAALLLLSKALTLAGADTKELILRREKSGRPYAVGREDLDFSLSHTKNAVACALMIEKDARVGVDIETAPTLERADAVSKRFFSESEREAVRARGCDGFTEIWTKKEALYKYLKCPMDNVSELHIGERENEKLESIDTEYGKIGLCRSKKAEEETKILKIILKS